MRPDIDSIPDELLPLAKRLKVFEWEYPSCVYFLLEQGRVVYVGQTTELRARIKAHAKSKSFDRVLFTEVPQEQLDGVEADLINQIAPRMNVVRPSSSGSSLREFLGAPRPIRAPAPPKRKLMFRGAPLPPECTRGHYWACDGWRNWSEWRAGEESCPSGEDVCTCSHCDCQACEILEASEQRYRQVYVTGTKKPDDPWPISREFAARLQWELDTGKVVGEDAENLRRELARCAPRKSRPEAR